MSQVAPQKPLRTERRLVKTARSIPSRGDSLRPVDHVGIETHRVSRSPWVSTSETHSYRGVRSNPASSQLVFGSACGPPKRAMVQSYSHVSLGYWSTAWGPIKAKGVGPSTHQALGMFGIKSHSLLACIGVRPGCPSSAYSSPRRAGVSESCEGAESSRSPRNTRLTDQLLTSLSPSSAVHCLLHQHIYILS